MCTFTTPHEVNSPSGKVAHLQQVKILIVKNPVAACTSMKLVVYITYIV